MYAYANSTEIWICAYNIMLVSKIQQINFESHRV